MKNNRKIKIISLISFFLISVLGTFLHFTYELSSNNLLIGSFSAVNESVWEHLKILTFGMFFISIYEYVVLKNNRNNFFTALTLKIIIGMVVIIVIYYTYTSIIGKSIHIIKIITFYIAILIAQIVWARIMLKYDINKNIEIFYLSMYILILLLFIIFTYVPPKLEIFRDNINNTYGIFEYI